MAGATPLLDVTFDNVALANFTPNLVAVVDAGNSGPNLTAAATAAATAGLQPLGVIMDSATKDFSGAVTSKGMTVRISGIAYVYADGTIAAGAFVGTSATNAGRVVAVTRAGAGVQPAPVLGRAITSGVVGDLILVLLTPGGTF